MEEYDWPTVAKQCSNLLRDFICQILTATGQPAISATSQEWFTQMASFSIPTDDWQGLKTRLYDEYRIEAPTIWWNNKTLLRLSVNAYNAAEDLASVASALHEILKYPWLTGRGLGCCDLLNDRWKLSKIIQQHIHFISLTICSETIGCGHNGTAIGLACDEIMVAIANHKGVGWLKLR